MSGFVVRVRNGGLAKKKDTKKYGGIVDKDFLFLVEKRETLLGISTLRWEEEPTLVFLGS